MPILTKAQPIIKQEIKGIQPLRYYIEKKGVSFLPEEKFFLCECYHPDGGHFLGMGKCDYPYCDCIAFTYLELKIDIEITLLDLFKLKNTGSEDDPNFWLQFKEWEKKYGKIIT